MFLQACVWVCCPCVLILTSFNFINLHISYISIKEILKHAYCYIRYYYYYGTVLEVRKTVVSIRIERKPGLDIHIQWHRDQNMKIPHCLPFSFIPLSVFICLCWRFLLKKYGRVVFRNDIGTQPPGTDYGTFTFWSNDVISHFWCEQVYEIFANEKSWLFKTKEEVTPVS